MLTRRSFLRRAGAAVALLALPRIPVAEAAAPVEPELVDGGTLELGVIRDSILLQRNDFQIFGEMVASGGLCAPIKPYYTLHALNPVADALPALRADRGGIRYERPEG